MLVALLRGGRRPTGIDTILGIALVLATIALVWWTRTMANATKEYVGLTRDSLTALRVSRAPVLALATGSRTAAETVTGSVVVHNVGGGPALDVIVETSWGEARVATPVLRPDEREKAEVTLSSADWQERRTEDRSPVPLRVRLTDSHGASHNVAAIATNPGKWIASVTGPSGTER